jgi:hypothetical protein
LLDTTPFKRLFDACPIRKGVELTNPENTHYDSFYDVAQRPTNHDDSDGEQKIRQKDSYLGNKRIPKTGHGNHRIHSFPPW